MGGGGKGQPSQDWNAVAYQNAFQAAQRGASLQDSIAAQPNYADATRAAYQAYGAQNQAFHMPSFHMPSFNAPSGPSYEEQLAEQQRAQGVAERDQLYSGYMNAASTATDFINQQIEEERSNAELLGIEFNITDEQKQERIQGYFSNIWGAGDQSRLETLMQEYGNPAGFDGWLITRGAATTQTPESDPTGTPGTGTRKNILTDEDEDLIPGLGASQVILGG